VRQRLIERLEAQGYVVSREPELQLEVNGRRLDPSSVEGKTYRFELPTDVRELRIVSRTTVPSGIKAEKGDTRRLGVGLAGMTLHAGGGLSREIALADLPLGDGFHRLESNSQTTWRWTDGDACVPVSLLDGAGAGTLELRLQWLGTYWTKPEQPAEAARLSA
jgi:hypothetical protein